MSKLTTRAYSTSFSMGIYCLNKRFHDPIYSVYGFVRFADEIVDTFHEYDKKTLIEEFERDTYLAIDRKISMNPILNSFQQVVHQYNITNELIDSFIISMKCDLDKQAHDLESYRGYIYGSAEVVGLMCLKVYVEGDDELYKKLKPFAQKLGSAFQKVNFLRDLKTDHEYLGRVYFPGVDMNRMTLQDKRNIEHDIEADFKEALTGIKELPKGARFGVYVAFVYYRNLFFKIKALSPSSIFNERIRIPNYKKIFLLFSSYFRHSFGMI